MSGKKLGLPYPCLQAPVYLKKGGLHMPAESPEVAEGITGNINPGSISVPYTSADISVSSA